VARLAGVSETTVSRVYNNPERVDSAKVERVLKTARDLGYVPDKAASALRRKGTGIILFLEIKKTRTYDWTQIPYYNWFYAEIVKTLFTQMESRMYQLRHYQARTVSEIAVLKRMNICDAVLAFNIEDADMVNALKKLNLPFICCHHTKSLDAVSFCSTDNYYGGKLAARALLEAGCTKPAYVTGYVGETPAHAERMNGFLDVFGRHAVTVLEGDIGIDGGVAAGRRLAGLVHKGEADCIGVVNDLTAIGVIHALTAAEITIPEQVSIVGYDNLPFAIALPFRLATVDLFLNKIYARAVDLLIRSIRNGGVYREVIKPALVRGDSIKR